MHFLNLIKAWIYIGLCALALVGLVYLVESQKPAREEPRVDAEPMQPPALEEAAEPTGELEGPTADQPSLTNEEPEEEITEVIEPDLSEPEEETAKVSASDLSEPAIEVVSDEGATEVKPEVLAETTEFEALPDDNLTPAETEPEATPTATAEAESSPAATAEPETIEEPETEIIPVPELPVTLCLPLDVASIKSQTINLQEQLVLELNEEATVKAPATGTVTKIFESPYTGKTIYLFDADGSYVYLLGGFSSLLGTVVDNAEIPCDSPMGTIAAEGKLYLGVLKLEVGQSWWQGKPQDPRSLMVGDQSGK